MNVRGTGGGCPRSTAVARDFAVSVRNGDFSTQTMSKHKKLMFACARWCLWQDRSADREHDQGSPGSFISVIKLSVVLYFILRTVSQMSGVARESIDSVDFVVR